MIQWQNGPNESESFPTVMHARLANSWKGDSNRTNEWLISLVQSTEIRDTHINCWNIRTENVFLRSVGALVVHTHCVYSCTRHCSHAHIKPNLAAPPENRRGRLECSWAAWRWLAGRTWPAGRQLNSPSLDDTANIYTCTRESIFLLPVCLDWQMSRPISDQYSIRHIYLPFPFCLTCRCVFWLVNLFSDLFLCFLIC